MDIFKSDDKGVDGEIHEIIKGGFEEMMKIMGKDD